MFNLSQLTFFDSYREYIHFMSYDIVSIVLCTLLYVSPELYLCSLYITCILLDNTHVSKPYQRVESAVTLYNFIWVYLSLSFIKILKIYYYNYTVRQRISTLSAISCYQQYISLIWFLYVSYWSQYN